MAKKIKKYKVGLDSETMAISLVSEPAIEIDFIHMSKDEEEKQQVFLEKDEKYLVYGAVLVPEKDIYRNNGEQEYYLSFTKESIEKMENEYMKDFKQYNVSLQHQENIDEVCMVESWLVMDSYKDKANALGFDVPVGTWMCAMKVNNVDTWNRIKSGELKGFSVESIISLEEFNKQNDNNTINMDEMSFWTKMKEVLKEAFGKAEEETKVDPIEPIAMEDMEAQKPTETVTETPTVETPTETPVEEPKAEEPTPIKEEVKEEPVEPENEPTEAPKDDTKHLEELINSLKEEINALKEMNTGLNNKVKEMSKEPSAKPISTNAKPSGSDTYLAWREQMRKML